ncbi:MAG: DMP19 family protein [Flavobacteriales bacterium]|nr:DMP19 family protein [Flavobacteriales bacterium]
MRRLITILIITSVFLSCKQDSNLTDNQIKTELEKEFDTFFEEFNNRPIYKNLTQEIIDTISDDNLIQTVYDNIELIGDEKKLSNGQKAIYSIWWVEAEVNNGGFNQFYFNSSSKYSQMAYDGFKLIGAVKFAELMNTANNLYEENKEELAKYDDGTLQGFSDSYDDNPLNELDTKFYKLYDEEDLYALQIKYIRSNVNEFISLD